MRFLRHHPLACLLAVLAALTACVSSQAPGDGSLHRWWAGFGPVLPHDTFPADCKLCHVGDQWDQLRTDFKFDHEAKTGVPLLGAHARAQCLRCHNDRGPVAVFASRGCAGCHADVHEGDLGAICTACHTEASWVPVGQIELHNRTRFPLTGAHALVACQRCHPGARVGNFQPTDTECLTCHTDDLQNAINPPHIALGYVDNCQRCHLPTTWQQATVQPATVQPAR